MHDSPIKMLSMTRIHNQNSFEGKKMPATGQLENILITYDLRKVQAAQEITGLLITLEVKNLTHEPRTPQKCTCDVVSPHGEFNALHAPIEEVTIPAGQIRAISFIMPGHGSEISAFLNLRLDDKRVRGAIRKQDASWRTFPWAVTPD